MSNLVKVNDQLMGLTISELNQVQSLIQEVKVMKAKSTISVGDRAVSYTHLTLPTNREV